MGRISAGTRLALRSNLLHVDRRTDTTKLVGCFEDSLFEKKKHLKQGCTLFSNTKQSPENVRAQKGPH